MKKLLFAIIIIAFAVTTLHGEENQTGRIEAEKIAFFTRRMDLSPEEAKLFWPVYNDYVSRRNKIRLDKNNLLKYLNQNYKNLDDKELEESGDKVIAYTVEEAMLTQNYHKKFKEILPPFKVIMIYQTETQFNKILLEQLRNRRSQQQPIRRR
jgi:hypothetical protein